MTESFKHSREPLSNPDVPEVKSALEFQSSEQRSRFEIEFNGQKFSFLEIQPTGPSNTLLVHFPGFGEDAEQYADPMHDVMGKNYHTLALKGYGETYSRESLIGALGQAIQLRKKQNTILHGDSFGAAVVYDLISDSADREFLKRINVRGAILEAPFLDKKHLQTKVRSIPDAILLRGSLLFDKIRSLESLTPTEHGLVQLSNSQKKSMISEALREKTAERKIDVPVHVVLVQYESLSDNGKIMETLQNQADKISSSTVRSARDNGHRIADGQYENMWKKEKEVIEDFTKPVLYPPTGTEPESPQN